MHIRWMLLPLLLITTAASASEPICQPDICPVGSSATTHATLTQPFYACPTEQLSEYVTVASGLLAAYAEAGVKPDVSPTTGEPIVEGAAKGMLDHLRSIAGVSTFDQATAKCRTGHSGVKVRIVQLDDAQVAITGIDGKDQQFWVPVSALTP